jgi:hypothetical protein
LNTNTKLSPLVDAISWRHGTKPAPTAKLVADARVKNCRRLSGFMILVK